MNFMGYRINDLPDAPGARVCLIPAWDPVLGTWALQRSCNEYLTQSPVSASNATPINCNNGMLVTETLTENTTIGAPTNPQLGAILIFQFTQDGTGGRTVAWNAVFKFTTYAWTNTGNTANKKAFAAFMYDGANWQSMIPAANTWF